MLSKLSAFRPSECLALTIGTFDGVHLGHRAVIRKLLETAKAKKIKSAVLTFPIPPMNFLSSGRKKKLIIPFEKRAELLEKAGIDYVITVDFAEIMGLSAGEFIERLLAERLKAKAVVVSGKFMFGKKREGDMHLLKRLSKKYGFEAYSVRIKKLSGKTISSTAIRQALEDGNIRAARGMLGYNPVLEGSVVHGLKIGRQLGFPTANLHIDSTMQIPKEGIYACFVLIEEKRFRGALYIGKRPTFGGKKTTVEATIIDEGFSEELYGKKMEVQIIERIRDDMRFKNEGDLIDQIRKDVEKARRILNSSKVRWQEWAG
ncbi:MAG: bifunctional riboflavin kinase/FAD synthetase [Candidatus Aenigmarchaeota archaeon]|nr:bifunctional riboflavin kinase/FAD synthetase [Candidatus Aenigmarchaeota archaeon]